MSSNVRNQGIAHLAYRAGGAPFCKSVRAHIVCAVEDAAKWGTICKRCKMKAAVMHEKALRHAKGNTVTKFAATSATDLRTEARNAGRVARKVEYVVTVEVDDGSWCELDADSEAHAKTLAQNWVDTLGARGCSCWRVRLIDGRLAKNSFYHYYWTPADEPAQLEA